MPSESDPKPDTHPLANTEQLLTQAMAGSEQARAELLERYREPLKSFVHRRMPARVRTLVETNDIVQDAQLAALQSLGQFEYRGINSMWSYLRQIALNMIRRAERKVDGRGMPQGNSTSFLAEKGSSPSSHARDKESFEALEAALLTLPPQAREALLMRIELNIPYELVARECGFSSSDAARMAIVRATARLASELSKHAP